MTVRQLFPWLSLGLILSILLVSLLWTPILVLLLVVLPLVALGFYDMTQKRQAIKRLYPVIGRFRYMFESVRPEIQQYFVESDIDGRPVPREFRSLVYQRAKKANDTRPFGTLFDVNRIGYEWINHSVKPQHTTNSDPRIEFGAQRCNQPYRASPLNISAMSYGALSKNAIMALNKGARMGGFAHNTGEGGISPYHLQNGGDLIWQIGTGYFGCRNQNGDFDADLFARNAQRESVKMIEVKISQGAKPGHGGILPAAKLTEEIAQIRHVPMGQDVISPPGHSAFSSPKGLLEFIDQLRELSGGKPVGFKLCIGDRSEFLAICKAMIETGRRPDFITIDGGEGGTGAAPTEFTNSVGTPLRDGLWFANSALIGSGVRDEIRIIASAKMFSAFHIVRALALGADTVNSARGMMFALGCIQSRTCNTDRCPTGIATQNHHRAKALVVEDKATRVANFHRETVHALVELLATAGLSGPEQLRPEHLNQRVSATQVKNYAQLYPQLNDGCLLDEMTIPAAWREDWDRANSDMW